MLRKITLEDLRSYGEGRVISALEKAQTLLLGVALHDGEFAIARNDNSEWVVIADDGNGDLVISAVYTSNFAELLKEIRESFSALRNTITWEIKSVNRIS